MIVTIQLNFRGDDVMNPTFERLKVSVGHTYYAVTPFMRFRTNRIPIPSPKVPLAPDAKFMLCLYISMCVQGNIRRWEGAAILYPGTITQSSVG